MEEHIRVGQCLNWTVVPGNEEVKVFILGIVTISLGDWQWRTEVGGLGCSNPPRNSEGLPKSCQTQPDCENLKIAEFRTPTHQDVRKKGSKILKLPRFAIVLH